MNDVEATFLADMVAHQDDPGARWAFADWLAEQGDRRAELLRIQEQLRRMDVAKRQKLEARMQQLLRDGIDPIVPRMTNSLGMRFVFIFPGEFIMGDADEPDEVEQVRVSLTRGFWLSETVVTQRQWIQLMQTEPWTGGRGVREQPDSPATQVDWEHAMEFCRQLTDRERTVHGHSYSLPTEAQWEYACRAGTATRYSFGDDVDELPGYGWCLENTILVKSLVEVDGAYVRPVGRKRPNPWGLFDMHGNVCEWCRDSYQDQLPGGIDPLRNDKPGSVSERVGRGGCWNDFDFACGSASRDGFDPARRNSLLGFRPTAC